MSRENVEWWQRSADAWSRGDREAWLGEFPPEWEMHTSGVFPGLKPVYKGREGGIELWEAMRDPWETFAVDVERVEDLGDKVLALVSFDVQGRDGLETSREWAYVVIFSGEGLPLRTENFSTWDAALEAVGLSE
jgi:ketosteroid isomerase-like protein